MIICDKLYPMEGPEGDCECGAPVAKHMKAPPAPHIQRPGDVIAGTPTVPDETLTALLLAVALKVQESKGPKRAYWFMMLAKMGEEDGHAISDLANDMRAKGYL